MKHAILTITLGLGLITSPAFAQLKFIEGRDYQSLPTVIEQTNSPTVQEFFWYGCSHCNNVYPAVKAWIAEQKEQDIVFESIPAIPSERWAIGGQLYYTAKALEMDIDAAVFDAVHNKNKKDLINDPEAAKAFLVAQGADKEKVEQAWNSLAVQQDMTRAIQLFENSGLGGVPAFVINGAYEAQTNGEYESFFKNLNELTKSKQTQAVYTVKIHEDEDTSTAEATTETTAATVDSAEKSSD